MSGGSLNQATSEPLMTPQRRPSRIGTPKASAALIGVNSCLASRPAKMPEIARIEPTERSMPRERMTNSIPIEMMPITLTWSRIRMKLVRLAKPGATIENPATRRTSTI